MRLGLRPVPPYIVIVLAPGLPEGLRPVHSVNRGCPGP